MRRDSGAGTVEAGKKAFGKGHSFGLFDTQHEQESRCYIGRLRTQRLYKTRKMFCMRITCRRINVSKLNASNLRDVICTNTMVFVRWNEPITLKGQ